MHIYLQSHWQRQCFALLVGGMISSGVFLTSQGGSVAQETITVTAIESLSQDGIGGKVYLTGKVQSQAPFLGQGAYELVDETGKSIWILTEQSLPNPGEEILIEGQLQYQRIPIAGQEIGSLYVRQLQQLNLSQYAIVRPETPDATVVTVPPTTPTPSPTPRVEPTATLEEPATPTIEVPTLEPPKPRKLPFEPEFLPHQ